MLSRKMSLGLVVFGIFYATIASGKTYQCRNSSGQTMISDTPCPVGSKTEKVRIFTPASPPAPKIEDGSTSNTSSVHQGNLRYLDMKVDEAIGARDFREAKQLALTPEHWEKINAAEKNSEMPIGKAGVELKQQPQQEALSQQQNQQQKVLSQQQIMQPQQQSQLQQPKQQEVQRQEMQKQRQEKIMQAQQLQQQELQGKQQLQQQQMQERQQLQQQEATRLKQELEKQVPVITKAMENAGSNGAAVRSLMIQNQINQLNQTAKHGVYIQKE